MARDGNIEENGGVLVRVNEDVGAFIASTGGASNRCAGDQLGDLADPVFTTLAVL